MSSERTTRTARNARARAENIELKKLVYLYLINYAKTQPELTLLAVNTFVKDAKDPNPLIRALAVRTMGCIRVEKITEYLCEPLRRALRDDVSERWMTDAGTRRPCRRERERERRTGLSPAQPGCWRWRDEWIGQGTRKGCRWQGRIDS